MVLFSCSFEVPNHAIKKNSKEIRKNFRTGRFFIGSNSRVIDAGDYLVAKLVSLNKRVGIDFDVNVKMIFYYPKAIYYAKAGHRSARVGDLSNLYQIVEDSLQKAGIIKNDSFICSHDGSCRIPIDGDKFRLELEIKKAPCEA